MLKFAHMEKKIYAKNRQAHYNYEILEKLEAGLVLSGAEAKAVKQGKVNLKGAYINFQQNKAGIAKMHIGKYEPAGAQGEYDPTRWRPILLHKKQIAYLLGKEQEKGLTIIPLMVYTISRYIKVEIGICKGRKTYNKKEIIKKRDTDRELKRALKGNI